MANVIVNLGPLKRFVETIRQGFETAQGPVAEAFESWGTIYRAAMKKRFLRLSRGNGGGEWPPLAESTIRQRRHGKRGRYKRGRGAMRRAKRSGGGQVSILWDTGTLVSTLDPVFHGRGQIQKVIRGGLKVGIGGPEVHPSGRLTIGKIAQYHQQGLGRLPQRKILVPPDRQTTDRFAKLLDLAIRRAKSRSGA